MAKAFRSTVENLERRFDHLKHSGQSDFTLGEFTHCVPAVELALSLISTTIDQKSHDPRLVDLHDVSDIADYFVIASATSERHAKGIADNIIREARKLGEAPTRVSGYEDGSWIIIDFDNVVAHIFHEPIRQYYKFDELWQKAPHVELPENLAAQQKRLRTGMYL